MYKKLFLIIAIVLLNLNISHASLILDLGSESYANIPAILQSFGTNHVSAIIVNHPFWHYRGRFDKGFAVYDWSTGLHLRGALRPHWFDPDTLKSLSDFLRRSHIKLYMRADIFDHRQDYYLKWLSPDCFETDSLLYSSYPVIDIHSPALIKAYTPLFQKMRQLPVDKWIISFANIPAKKQSAYFGFALQNLEGKVFALSSSSNNVTQRNFISSYNYWQLRKGPFLSPAPDLSELSNMNLSASMDNIQSDELSVNNIATATYLLSLGHDVVIPESFIKQKDVAMIFKSVKNFSEFKRILLKNNAMFLYSRDQIISFYLGEHFACLRLPRLTSENGLYHSLIGNSLFKTDKDGSYFFLLPESVYLWKIQ